MLFYNLVLSPGRYFVPFWIGKFLNCRLSGLSASFTRVYLGYYFLFWAQLRCL